MDDSQRRLSRIKRLSHNERLILILYYYEEMTLKEIAATLGMSQDRAARMLETVRNYITY